MRQKCASIALVLFFVVITPERCLAAKRRKMRPSSPNIHEQRRMGVITHITKALGNEYASRVVNDKRFVFDNSLIPKKLGVTPSPKIPKASPKPNYDYVFSEWSKQRGPAFISENEEAFRYEEEHSHVPREFISSILNIETQWGMKLGSRLVVPTLYTRAVFCREEKSADGQNMSSLFF